MTTIDFAAKYGTFWVTEPQWSVERPMGERQQVLTASPPDATFAHSILSGEQPCPEDALVIPFLDGLTLYQFGIFRSIGIMYFRYHPLELSA